MDTRYSTAQKPFADAGVETGEQVNRLAVWRIYGYATSIYLLATLATDAFFMGDANDYVESILAYRQGHNLYFWEFGHLLWRPFGWFMAELLHPVTSRFVGSFPRANVMLTLVWINLAAGLLGAVCLVHLLRRFCRKEMAIGAAITGFVFSQGVLNFSQTGSSYIPGLAFLLLGLCFITAPATTKQHRIWNDIAAGFSFAVSVGFWFLFIWALPAAILLPLIQGEVTLERVRRAVASSVSFSVFVGAFYLMALVALRITDIAGIKAWIVDAGHGIYVRGLTRMVLGFARSFINMGNDGMLMKRFLIGDPYNKVTIWQLAHLSLWKLGLFYVFLVTSLWMMWKSEKRATLFLLLGATTPVFGFAYFFGPGDIERYLACYPFLILLVVQTIETTRASVWMKAIPCVFLAVIVVVNFQAMFRPNLTEQQERIAARLGDLPMKLSPNSELVAVNWQDELVNFYRSFPFHPLNQRESYVVAALVTPGVEDSKHWRDEFAKRALRVWSVGGDIWLSNRAYALRPEAHWNWVEGDDQYVSWKDFPEFCANLKMGESSGGTDGFQRVLPSEENKQFLQHLMEASMKSQKTL
ncbi:MAG: hypothetical protein JNK38_04305 [Acidobacteria bacterium]|nr:hypothetical protein [Acidobacteriota bacterium]